jgi:hypothetical protein
MITAGEGIAPSLKINIIMIIDARTTYVKACGFCKNKYYYVEKYLFSEI